MNSDYEIKFYIELNRSILPMEKEWDKLLPKMIKELPKIGWNTHIKFSTRKLMEIIELT